MSETTRLDVLNAQILGLAHMRELVELALASSDAEAFLERVAEDYGLTDVQAQAVGEFSLRRIAHYSGGLLEAERDALLEAAD